MAAPAVPAGVFASATRAAARLRLALSFSAALLLAAAGCRFVSTPLHRILDAPARFQGQEVTVEGLVEAPRWIPGLGALGFRLVDGRDSVLVLTTSAVPSGKARLVATVARDFPVDGSRRLVLLYRLSPGNGEPSSRADTR